MNKVLISAAAVAVSAAVHALGPSMYSEPTYSQMERAIAAAKGEGYPTNVPSLYSRPTYSQMERLITAIGAGGGSSDTNSVLQLVDGSFDGGTQNVNRVTASFDGVSNRVAAAESGIRTLTEQNREKTDLAVYRKVKDIWTWKNYDDPDADSPAPEDFLAVANSPGAMPLYFKGDAAGGNWFGANQYWPSGKLKYDQGYGPGGQSATVLNFKCTAYAEDGVTQLYRFGATATRESATDETLVSWDDADINQFVRVATTDLASYWDDVTFEKAKEYSDATKPGSDARTLPPYLHVLDFDDTYPDDAQWYYDQIDHAGYCSSVRRGNEYGRNYDWRYDDSAVFVVRMSPAAGRFASVGVANAGTNLTESVVTGGRWSRYYKCLPGHTVDGINEKGVVCNINVVPTNGTPWEVHGDDPLPEGRGLNMLGACRYALDRCATAKDAAEYVAANAYIPRSMTALGDSLHMMVADAGETWIVEDAVAYRVEYGGDPVMTNRRWKKDVPDPYGAGSEREAIIAAATGPMTGVVSRVWYTNSYRPGGDGEYPWPTEFAGMTDAEGMIPNTETNRLQAWAKTNVTPYLPPKRNYGFWQTVHSCVYDITNRTMRIAVQETGDWYVFSSGKTADALAFKVNGVAPTDGNVDVKEVYNDTNTVKIDGDGKVYEKTILNKGGHWLNGGTVQFSDCEYDATTGEYVWKHTNPSSTDKFRYNPASGIFKHNYYGQIRYADRKNLNPFADADLGTVKFSGSYIEWVFDPQQSGAFPQEPTTSLLRRSELVAPSTDVSAQNKPADAKAVGDALLNKLSKDTLAGKTYDLSQDGQLVAMATAVARALGATVTHTSTDSTTGESIAPEYGITPTDTTTFGDIQDRAGLDDSATPGAL